MVLLRRVIGDALRARRQAQHRTLREVSTAANVSLGYLSEIERGQKEPSSELLSAVCEALGAQLSELLRDVSYSVEDAERVAAPATQGPVPTQPAVPAPVATPAAASAKLRTGAGARVLAPRPTISTTVDGDVSVTVRQETPLKATLRTTRNSRPGGRTRDILTSV